MKPFKPFSGVAAPLLRENIDTDTIIPSREMQKVSRSGLGDGLFAGWRYKAPISREINPEFVLNKAQYENARIILAGKNFGCGSSREHAPWALLDFGITCVISSSFADIFHNNCFKNGILPVTLDEEKIKELSEYANRKEEISIDLVEEKVLYGNNEVTFKVDPFKKKCLLEGLDEIALSLNKSNKIESFENNLKSQKPWIFND